MTSPFTQGLRLQASNFLSLSAPPLCPPAGPGSSLSSQPSPYLMGLPASPRNTLLTVLHSQTESWPSSPRFLALGISHRVPSPPHRHPAVPFACTQLALDSELWHWLPPLPGTLILIHPPRAFQNLLLSPYPRLYLHATSSERYALTSTAKGTCSVTFGRLVSFTGTQFSYL